MPRFERVLVVSPHADDEVLGCGGLLASCCEQGTPVHVVYLAVDGMQHYGLAQPTSFQQRLAEIERVSQLLGFTFEIAFANQGLTERLDKLPRRTLVDLIEGAANLAQPDLLLLPSGADYDQDHVAAFLSGFAAARPIASQFGKWFVPNVMSYEMAKIQWAAGPLPVSRAFLDIGPHLDRKLEALRCYESQLRPRPHIRSPEAVTALATLRGAEAGVAYAEAFEVLRTLL